MSLRPLPVIFVVGCGQLHPLGPERAAPNWQATAPLCRERAAGCPPFLIGHAGSPRREAENTLPSFESALNEGANAIETDICLTRDGELVLWHNRDPDDLSNLTRVTDERMRFVATAPRAGDPLHRPVDELTLEELRASHGYRLRRSVIADFLWPGERASGYDIPTVGELAEWAREHPRLQAIYLDSKISDAQEAPLVADRVAEIFAGADYLVFLSSPKESIARAYRERLRSHHAGSSVRVILELESGDLLARAQQLDLDAISAGLTRKRSFRDYLAQIARASFAHAAHYPILAWTIDDPRQMRALLEAGVDGMITDDIPALLQVISERGAKW